MLALKYILIAAGVMLLAAALVMVLFYLWMQFDYQRKKAGAVEGVSLPAKPEPLRWRVVVILGLVACLPMLAAESIVVIPAGMGGVRISQMQGILPGTLYAGTHLIAPLVESVDTFDLRDHLFTAGSKHGAKGSAESRWMFSPRRD